MSGTGGRHAPLPVEVGTRQLRPSAGASRRQRALAGVLAAAAALAVAELLAGLLSGAPSLVIAVADRVVDAVPGRLERWAIGLLGSADKPLLLGGVLVLSGLAGAALGLLTARSSVLAAVGVVTSAVLGGLAALGDPRAERLSVLLVVLAGAGAGVTALRSLSAAAAAPGPAGPGVGVGVQRRHFLRVAMGVAVAAVATGGGGLLLTARQTVQDLRAAIRLPRPARPAPPVPLDAELGVTGLTPLYVPNASFYRIDTALRVPQVDPTTWRLEVRGLVDRPFSLSYAELLELPQIEADITLACVSNRVGGDLVGNARWQGVPLRALLERAGLQERGTQVLARSVDGFTAGFPVRHATERDATMVALGMNGEPLPQAHGFPARLVVPGLYGYVSATKWLSAIELTDFSRVDGYWVPRGWAKEGPVLTSARIDVPRRTGVLAAGRQPVAGVAWAPGHGITRVEVQIDDGPWEQARLAASLGDDSWRQWVLEWDAAPGRHRITVRATDGTGQTQTAERTDVAPSGARGQHTIQAVVAGD